MYKTKPTMTGGCQCGAVRYALFEMPKSTICHCRMCQKAVGGPFAALCKVPTARSPGLAAKPASFQSSSVAERHFCCGLRHAADVPLSWTAMRSRSPPAAWISRRRPPTKNFGVEARLPWIELLMPGQLPDTPTAEGRNATREVISRQHPDHDTPVRLTVPHRLIV